MPKAFETAQEKIVDVAHAAVDTVKETIEKIPFLGDDFEPVPGSDNIVYGRKTKRYHDKDNNYKMVSREQALGSAALSRTINQASSTKVGNTDKSTAVKAEKKLTIEQATQNRYSLRMTSERLDRMEQARQDIAREKAALEQAELDALQAQADAEQAAADAEARRYQEWNERKTPEYLKLKSQAKKELIDEEDLPEWIEQRLKGQTTDEAFVQTVLEQKKLQPHMREMLRLSSQIREARAEFNRLLNEGEEDEEAYWLQVTFRENKLQDLLIKYQNEISQEQQDFIIEFTDKGHNKQTDISTEPTNNSVDTVLAEEGSVRIVGSQAAPIATTPNVDPVNPDAAGTTVGPQLSEQDSTPTEESLPSTGLTASNNGETVTDSETGDAQLDQLLNAAREAKLNGDDEALWEIEDDISDRVYELAASNNWTTDQEEDMYDFLMSLVDDAPSPDASTDGSDITGGPETASEGAIESVSEGPESVEVLGENEELLAKKLQRVNPALYGEYMQARQQFINNQARSRGANVSPEQSEASRIAWLKSKLSAFRARFQDGEEQRASDFKDFDQLYRQAREEVVAAQGDMTPHEEREFRLGLESNAAKQRERAISQLLVDSDSQQSYSVTRMITKYGGLGLVAAAAGGFASGVAERMRLGDHGLNVLFGGVFGALAGGYAASKIPQSKRDNSIIESNASQAVENVQKGYGKYDSDEESLQKLRERSVGLDGNKKITSSERTRALAKVAVGAGLGTAVAVGGHYLAHVSPTLAEWGRILGPDSKPDNQPVSPGPAADLTPDVVDTDLDTFPDTVDTFPDDPNEWKDTDGDKVGDNSDAFPRDASETMDRDGDNFGDKEDAFPDDKDEWVDTDKDGVGDNSDAFERDPEETADRDGDNFGDNEDAFPDDKEEWKDSDGDKVGDNSDDFPRNPDETVDRDGDNVGDNTDVFPDDINEWKDTDGDGIGDNADNLADETETQIEPVEPEGMKITIEQDSSFSNEFMQQYDIDKDKAYDLYGYLSERFGADDIYIGDGIYEMPNGDWGLHPGEAIMPTEVDNAAREWLAAHPN